MLIVAVRCSISQRDRLGQAMPLSMPTTRCSSWPRIKTPRSCSTWKADGHSLALDSWVMFRIDRTALTLSVSIGMCLHPWCKEKHWHRLKLLRMRKMNSLLKSRRSMVRVNSLSRKRRKVWSMPWALRNSRLLELMGRTLTRLRAREVGPLLRMRHLQTNQSYAICNGLYRRIIVASQSSSVRSTDLRLVHVQSAQSSSSTTWDFSSAEACSLKASWPRKSALECEAQPTKMAPESTCISNCKSKQKSCLF